MGGSVGPLADSQKTATGIFLPSSATASPLPEATVIAVGPGAANKEGTVVPVSVVPGDRVLLPGWGGNPIKVGEEVSFGFVGQLWAIEMLTDCRSTTCSRTRRSSPRSTSRSTIGNWWSEGTEATQVGLDWITDQQHFHWVVHLSHAASHRSPLACGKHGHSG